MVKCEYRMDGRLAGSIAIQAINYSSYPHTAKYSHLPPPPPPHTHLHMSDACQVSASRSRKAYQPRAILVITLKAG